MLTPDTTQAAGDGAAFRQALIQPATDQHSLPLSIALHLLPGALVTVLYILLVPPLQARGVNNLITLNLLALFVLAPLELAILYRAGTLRNGRASLEGVVLNREKLPLWQITALGLGMLLWMGLVSSLLKPVLDPLLKQSLFTWVPGWFPLVSDFAAMPKQELAVTLALSLVCTSWITPYVEELYFRGFLLPRLSRYGHWAALLNAVLFTLYHFFTPWEFVERVLMVTPLAWLVQKKRSLYIGVVAHVLGNTVGILPLLIVTLLG